MPYTVPPRPARGPGGSSGWRAAPEEMLQIQPRPDARMSGRTSCARCSGAVTWTSNMRSIRFRVNSSTRVKYVTAALETSTSTGPSSACTWSTSRTRSSGLARSACTATAVPPASRMRATVSPMDPASGCDPASTVRAETATRAPSAANNSAVTAPIPRLAPVTRAVLPSNTPISALSVRLRRCGRLVRARHGQAFRPRMGPKERSMWSPRSSISQGWSAWISLIFCGTLYSDTS